MDFIFHITERACWDAAGGSHEFRPDSLATEGFIHCSRADQVAGVANAVFQGRGGDSSSSSSMPPASARPSAASRRVVRTPTRIFMAPSTPMLL